MLGSNDFKPQGTTGDRHETGIERTVPGTSLVPRRFLLPSLSLMHTTQMRRYHDQNEPNKY